MQKVNIDLEDLVEVTFNQDDDFLKIEKPLLESAFLQEKKTIYQSCHILHKRGKYYIVHFKELFALDGLPTSIDENDLGRRNTIANLLQSGDFLK